MLVHILLSCKQYISFNLECVLKVSKDTTIQYLLTLMDDVLQEDKARVEIFKDYSSGRKESPWVHLLTLLNRPDGFIMNMSAR